jgi:stalled ribosome rescue protein Dom34
MTAFVVWLDHQEAKMFGLSSQGIQSHLLAKKNHGSKRGKDHHDGLMAFYRELADFLTQSASEVLLLGPGTAKTEFLHFLERHRFELLQQRVVGVKSVDHPSEKEILAESRAFFRKYDLYAG